MKPAAQRSVNSQTAPAESRPAGRWRAVVRGFKASKRRSARRLKAIAALRANTMQRRIPASCRVWKPDSFQANTALVSANGNANSVWLKRINSSSDRTVGNMATLIRRGTTLACDRNRTMGRKDNFTPRVADAAPLALAIGLNLRLSLVKVFWCPCGSLAVPFRIVGKAPASCRVVVGYPVTVQVHGLRPAPVCPPGAYMSGKVPLVGHWRCPLG